MKISEVSEVKAGNVAAGWEFLPFHFSAELGKPTLETYLVDFLLREEKGVLLALQVFL